MDYKVLYAAIEEWRDKPFDFRKASCCHFVAKVVHKTTGRKFNVPELEGPEFAVKWLAAMGYSSLHAYLEDLFGPPIPILQAKRGDIAYIQEGIQGAAIGIVERGAWFMSDKGLINKPLKECTCAFKVE